MNNLSKPYLLFFLSVSTVGGYAIGGFTGALLSSAAFVSTLAIAVGMASK